MTLWLSQIESGGATVRKGLTSASVRKMIARIQEELAEYEAASAATPPGSTDRSEAGDPSAET